jgi:uncharacterized protein YbjT (DUF2867 family)
MDAPEYDRVHALVRRDIPRHSDKLIVHKIDFDALHDFNPEGPIDHVFCCLGTTIKKAGTKEKFRQVDYEYVVALANKARSWNADKFLVISSLGANHRSGIFYNRVKGEMEKALEALDFPNLLIFRPSLLMGDRDEFRAGEKTAVSIYKIINPLFVGKLKKYKGIEARQVALGMLRTALGKHERFKILESDEIQNI